MATQQDQSNPPPDQCDGRTTEDRVLRRHRFKIYSRPRRGEPIWIREGKVWKESVALAEIGYQPRKTR